MMKQWYCIIFYCALITCTTYPMDPLTAKRTTTLLWLADNLLIFGSRDACYINNPLALPSVKQIHNQLPRHIIANKDKTKVALLCENALIIYDCTIGKKTYIISQLDHHNYSATFGPSDEIIRYHKGDVMMNGRSLHLPCIESDATFEISCNYQTKEVMYPSSNNTFTRKSLIDGRFIRHSRILTHNDKKYRICSALYNPHSPHIALHTEEKKTINNTQSAQKMFLLCSRTRTISPVLLKYKNEEEKAYHHAQFVPHSSLIAILCPHYGLHFWDFIQQQDVWVESIQHSQGKCKSDRNIFAINLHAEWYAAIAERNYFMNTIPQHVLRDSAKKHISFVYWFLRNYHHNNDLLSKDIIRILIYCLYFVYNIKPQ